MNQGGIDLWQFPLDDDPKVVNAALGVLCPDERTQYRQFGNSRLAAAFAIRRAYRRVILARYLEIEPLEVRICDTFSGNIRSTAMNGFKYGILITKIGTGYQTKTANQASSQV